MNRRELLAWAGIGCLANLSLSFVAAGQPSNLKKSDRTSTLYTKGRYLYDSLGNKVILRGINLPLLDDWNFPQTDKLAELEKTGANAVRIQWYKDYGQSDRPAYTIADLDNFLTRCKTSRIIPVLGLWDLTCKPDVNMA